MPILVTDGPVTLQGDGVPNTVLHPGQLSLGTITFGMVDSYGVSWILEEIKGWSDSPPTTGTVQPRPTDHGGWPTPAYYAPRTIEITGTASALTWDGAEAAVDRLMGEVPLDTLAVMQLATNTRLLQAMVRQDSDPLVAMRGGQARFSLSLVAPDPRRYSSDQVTLSTGLPSTSGGLTLPLSLPLSINATTISGVFTATNDGNMSTPPTFTISGPSPACTITHRGSGKTLRVPDAVPAGRTLTIDTAKRRAVLDGTAPRVVTGTWFEYDPGANEIAFAASTYDSGALLTSVHRSAWR